MTDEITRAELQAMIEVQSKSAQQMERVANSLATIVDEQKHISESLSGCTACKEAIKIITTNVTYNKWILTSLATVIGLGLIIIKMMEHLSHG